MTGFGRGVRLEGPFALDSRARAADDRVCGRYGLEAGAGGDPMRLNAEWHKANPMPKRPTLQERIRWHQDHREHCACRPIPAKLQEQMKRRPVS